MKIMQALSLPLLNATTINVLMLGEVSVVLLSVAISRWNAQMAARGKKHAVFMRMGENANKGEQNK